MQKLYFVLFFIFVLSTLVNAQPPISAIKSVVNKHILNNKTEQAESYLNSIVKDIKANNTYANQVFYLYIDVIAAYKSSENFAKGLLLYDYLQQRTIYKALHDSVKATILMQHGLLLCANKQYFESLDIYNYILKNYSNVLKQNLQFHALVYLEMAYSYYSLGYQKNEVGYTQKAVEIMESNILKAKEVDYLVSYNNLFYYYCEYDDDASAIALFNKFRIYYLAKYQGKTSLPNYKYATRIFKKMEAIIAAKAQSEETMAHLKSFKFIIQNERDKAEQNKDITYYLSILSDVCDAYHFKHNNFTDGIVYANMFLKEAIAYKDSFNIMLAHSKLANFYREAKDYKQALYHVNASLSSYQFPPTSISKFGLETMKANDLHSLHKIDEALVIMENNLMHIIEQHLHKKIGIQQIHPADLKQLSNSRYINIFSTSALIFVSKYQQTKQSKHLQSAEILAKTAAMQFSEFYKKGEFNPTLDNLHKKISEVLLFIAIEKYGNNLAQKTALLNTIEQNSSLHLAKEFEKKLLQSNPEMDRLFSQQQISKEQLDYVIQKQTEAAGKISYGAKISALNKSKDSLDKQIANASKRFTNLTLDNFSVENIMKLLSKNEEIIKYNVAFENVYRVRYSNKNIIIDKLGKVETINTLVTNYTTKIKQIATNYIAESNTLYQQLIPSDIKQRVTFIPSDGINYLPFGSLQQPDSKQLLIQVADISYNYSLPLFYLHRNNVGSQNAATFSSFAPSYINTVYNAQPLQQLPFAQQEATAVADIFSGKKYIGGLATKQNFLAQSTTKGILHCSMHSLLFDDDFNKSCLIFNNAEPLFFSDLYKIAIPSQMVVLSACNTGAGKLKQGEGLMSLSRAFTYSGVQSTVVSLWQVPDKETTELMILFYKNLRKGLSKSAALTKAKVEFVQKNPIKSHPFYWSGFILTGNNDAIANNYLVWIYWILGAIIICASAFIAYRKFIRKT
jgi:CHAT domain-containing protein